MAIKPATLAACRLLLAAATACRCLLDEEDDYDATSSIIMTMSISCLVLSWFACRFTLTYRTGTGYDHTTTTTTTPLPHSTLDRPSSWLFSLSSRPFLLSTTPQFHPPIHSNFSPLAPPAPPPTFRVMSNPGPPASDVPPHQNANATQQQQPHPTSSKQLNSFVFHSSTLFFFTVLLTSKTRSPSLGPPLSPIYAQSRRKTLSTILFSLLSISAFQLIDSAVPGHPRMFRGS